MEKFVSREKFKKRGKIHTPIGIVGTLISFIAILSTVENNSDLAILFFIIFLGSLPSLIIGIHGLIRAYFYEKYLKEINDFREHKGLELIEYTVAKNGNIKIKNASAIDKPKNVKKEKEENSSSNGVGGIIAVIFIGMAIYFIIIGVNNGGSSGVKNDVSGCYYISDSYGDIYSDTKLCINSSSVTYEHRDVEKKFYPEWIGDSLYIVNEYEENMFICNVSRENSDSIKCDSYNAGLGTGTYTFEKN